MKWPKKTTAGQKNNGYITESTAAGIQSTGGVNLSSNFKQNITNQFRKDTYFISATFCLSWYPRMPAWIFTAASSCLIVSTSCSALCFRTFVWIVSAASCCWGELGSTVGDWKIQQYFFFNFAVG